MYICIYVYMYTCITGGEGSMMVFLKPSPSIYVYLYNWRRREHDGILETISGTLDKKSNGSPSSMDSRVEMVSTLDLNMIFIKLIKMYDVKL